MTSDRRPHVLHVITGLGDGGAEAVLFRLVRSDTENTHHVISLSDRGKYASLLEEVGASVEALGMQAGRPSVVHFVKLIRMIRNQNPDIVQTWMYHADFFGGVAARIAGVNNVYWGLHNGVLDRKTSKRSTIFISRINAFLSRFVPRKIISCSGAAADVHEALGYRRKKMVVVPNGYDLSEYLIDENLRKATRVSLEITGDETLLGMVARFDPQKDHATLLEALSVLSAQGVDFRCLLVGAGLTGDNSDLVEKIFRLGLQDKVLLLGQRNDIPSIMNALDVHILSSNSGEAFPNVLCESMACGTPCVTTNVGDAGFIVGATGWVVPPGVPQALAAALYDACIELTGEGRRFERRKLEARDRILKYFSIERMVRRYQDVWQGAEDRKGGHSE